MPSKKYIIREGFVVSNTVTKPNGDTYEKRSEGGEEITLDDDQAALHAHKLEFANQKDRDAALAAEKQASVDRAASQSPVDLMGMMTAVLTQALQKSGQAPAAAVITPA